MRMREGGESGSVCVMASMLWMLSCVARGWAGTEALPKEDSTRLPEGVTTGGHVATGSAAGRPDPPVRTATGLPIPNCDGTWPFEYKE
ncbi:hypothetical protein GCM10009609_07690 [Pseudonocardia aurantiaca]